MACADPSSPLIESRADLIEVLARGAKPKARWRIGTEHEKHVFYKDPIRPVPYEGPNGVHALLDGMATKTGWEPNLDNGTVIGLKDTVGGGAISLEPGGPLSPMTALPSISGVQPYLAVTPSSSLRMPFSPT